MVQPLYPNELQAPGLALEFQGYAPHRILQVPTYHFWMVDPATGSVMGRIDLRNANSEEIELYAGHIGYEVSEPFRGHRLAARAVEMLKPLAFRLALNPLWLTCNPENAASRRTLELAGGEFIEQVNVPEISALYAGSSRQKCRYRIALGEQYRSLDAAG